MSFTYLIVLYNQVSGKVEEPDQETLSSSPKLNCTAALLQIGEKKILAVLCVLF